MAANEKLKAAKQALKEATTEHKTNVKALAAAQKVHDKSEAKVSKAAEKVAKLDPKPEAGE